MSMGADILSAMMTDLPEQTAQVRYAGTDAALAGTVAAAFCTGLDRQQDATEQGLVLAASGNVRYLASAEPAAWASAIQGKPIEILFYGATEWTRARVHGRMPMAGAVRLTVTAEFENQ